MGFARIFLALSVCAFLAAPAEAVRPSARRIQKSSEPRKVIKPKPKVAKVAAASVAAVAPAAALPESALAPADTATAKSPAATPAAPVSPGVKAKVDSILTTGTMSAQNEDSLAQAEADSGTAAQMPGGRPGLPFEMRKPTRKEIAEFQRAVLKAVTAMEKKDFAKARKVLAHAEPTERLAQVYKAILMANVYNGLKDPARADSVLAACLEWVGGSTWQNYLLNRRIQTFPLTGPDDSARLQFYGKVIQAPVAASVKINFLYGMLQLQGFSGHPAGHEALLKRIVASAPADRRLDSLYQKLSPHLPPGEGAWEGQDLMLDLETRLSMYPAAIARSEAALKVVPGKPEKQQLHWNFATLLYRNKEYPKAIVAYTKWIEKYGETAEAVLQIARCHDRLQEPKKAILWYDRLLEKYPRHDKTSEIYWLRAWDLEASGDYEEAIEFYFRQLADFSANKRGDWANFRVGLCQFKAGNVSAALQAFRAIRDQVNSNAYPAGLYWEARARDSLKDTAGARATLIELALKYPLNFYGHTARQNLQARGAWADSLEPWKRFAPSSPEGIKAWMKSEMSGFRERIDHEFESDYLSIGKLLQFRLDTLALLTLRTVPAKTKNNPWFLYAHAKMFRNRGLHKEAYKLGLQLSYKVAPDRWGSAPKEVLRLFFPRPFEGLVQKYAAKRGLDPAFIYALMRQESGFDREIKSGAGAIGLMQIMPATGRMVAKQVKMRGFDPYDLVDPEVNISLGTAYIRDLRKEYKGQPHWVLANYNAGPEPTRRWQAAAAIPEAPAPAPSDTGAKAKPKPPQPREKPLDAVVEDISYWETRDYVKKVMGNYWTYRILWNNRSKAPAQGAQTAAQ